MLEVSILSNPQVASTMAMDTTERLALADRLRDETRAQHDLVEATPFSRRLLTQNLPQAAYEGQLWLYREILDVLEAELRRCDHPALRSLWDETYSRVQMLKDDLDWLRSEPPSDSACSAARDLQAWIRTVASDEPICLLGIWYVFEGSSLGGVFMSRFVAEQYGFTDHGFRYYAGHGAESATRWRAYRSALNSLVLSANDAGRIVQAAGATFDRIGKILGALVPA